MIKTVNIFVNMLVLNSTIKIEESNRNNYFLPTKRPGERQFRVV